MDSQSTSPAQERRDLAQHLVATAGLAAWTSQSASETVGLLKEEMGRGAGREWILVRRLSGGLRGRAVGLSGDAG